VILGFGRKEQQPETIFSIAPVTRSQRNTQPSPSNGGGPGGHAMTPQDETATPALTSLLRVQRPTAPMQQGDHDFKHITHYSRLTVLGIK